MTARLSGAAGAAVLVLVATACAPALRPPPASVAEIARSGPAAPGPATLPARARAEAAWRMRPDRVAVREAERAFLEAAEEDPSGTDALIGAARAKAWLAEHEPDAAAREALATSLVQTAQLCAQRRPGHPACDYWLGIALGVQAREKPSTADAGIKEMIAALRRAEAGDAALDEGGPARVLALVLLRAPGWPLGPGDPDAGLAEARRALATSPGYPPNLLAVAEALDKTGAKAEARASYGHALEAAASSVDPDAPDWEREARRALGR